MLKIKNVHCLLLLSALLVGCTEEIDYRQVKNIQGLLYKINENDPFSGKIINYPINSFSIPTSAICKADIKNGMPDGVMECTKDNVILYSGNYTAGKRDGAEHFFSEAGAKSFSSNWKNGVRDGVERRYNKEKGVLTYEAMYVNGRIEGVEKAWTEDGKTETINLVWKNGKPTGFRVENYGDQINYLDGQYHGLIKRMSFFGNKFFLKEEINYNNGKKDGVETVYIAPGKIEKVNTYESDKLMHGKIYKYASYGQGDVIGEYSVLRVDNIIENPDVYSGRRHKTIVVYDGLQSGTNEEGDLSYEIEWDKGILVSASAYKVINGNKVLVYKGVGNPASNYGYSDNAIIHLESLQKNGVEKVFHGDEFVGQVVWDAGIPELYAIKYNSLHDDKKDSNDFIISRPVNGYIDHNAREFTSPTEFRIITDGYMTFNSYNSLGIEKLESYEDSILDKKIFKDLAEE